MNQEKKDKLIELFTEALDRKEYISLHFSQYDKNNDFKSVSLEDVSPKAKSFAELLGVELEHDDDGEDANSFYINTGSIYLSFSYLTPEQIKTAEEEVE